MTKDEKQFPIQRDRDNPASSVPWWLAKEAWKFYDSEFRTGQSIERMAQRGGFSRDELLWFLRRENPLIGEGHKSTPVV